MLSQKIEWRPKRRTTLDRHVSHGIPGRREFNQFHGLSGYADHFAEGTRLMSASSGPLQQTGNPFGPTDLNHLVNRRKINPQVEAARADDGLIAKA